MIQKSYSKFNPEITFTDDTYVIIGSGIGGLCTAVFLAKAGKKVVILEQHYVPGGFTHTFNRKKGLTWDVGVHYVGNMDEDSQLRHIFDYLSDGQLQWDAIGDPYDVAYINGRKFEFVSGLENFRQQFHDYFPEDKGAIDGYIQLLQKAAKKSVFYFIQKMLPGLLKHTLAPILRRVYRPIAKKTTHEVLSSLTKNTELIAALCAQCGNYGLPPQESSFAAHAIVINHFMEGAYYPRGGANRVHETILDHLHTLGVSTYINATVEKILVSERKVQGISINGKKYSCANVISNAGIHNTFQRLLEPKHVPVAYQKLQKIPASTAHLCLYVGLNKDDKSLQLPKHNIWWYADEDIEAVIRRPLTKNALGFAYISFPSAKDSLWNSKHPDTATIQVIGSARYTDFEPYATAPWMNRGETYDAMKSAFKDKALQVLLQQFPHIEDHITHLEVSTPVSTQKFSGYQRGEIYGLSHTPERFKSAALRPKTSIKGLFLTGQDITLVGLGGAMASGILTAATIIKWKMKTQFGQIMK